jgi:hypothetical protein
MENSSVSSIQPPPPRWSLQPQVGWARSSAALAGRFPPPPHLKVPKRENFSLVFFALSEPIWVCDLGTGEKNQVFYQLTPDCDGFWFLPHTECAVNQKKI